eukprot:754120-Hanusia_phi.AAC.3
MLHRVLDSVQNRDSQPNLHDPEVLFSYKSTILFLSFLLLSPPFPPPSNVSISAFRSFSLLTSAELHLHQTARPSPIKTEAPPANQIIRLLLLRPYPAPPHPRRPSSTSSIIALAYFSTCFSPSVSSSPSSSPSHKHYPQPSVDPTIIHVDDAGMRMTLEMRISTVSNLLQPQVSSMRIVECQAVDLLTELQSDPATSHDLRWSRILCLSSVFNPSIHPACLTLCGRHNGSRFFTASCTALLTLNVIPNWKLLPKRKL